MPSALPSRLRRVLRKLDLVFVLTVLLPSLLAIAYYGVVASDVYISDRKSVV